MKGEAKRIRDHMDSLDAEIKKLTNEREEWWVKLREVQENCKHEFKKDNCPIPAEYWIDDCIKCGKTEVS
jgi:hypothetical protein